VCLCCALSEEWYCSSPKKGRASTRCLGLGHLRLADWPLKPLLQRRRHRQPNTIRRTALRHHIQNKTTATATAAGSRPPLPAPSTPSPVRFNNSLPSPFGLLPSVLNFKHLALFLKPSTLDFHPSTTPIEMLPHALIPQCPDSSMP
jgi:hypothetical protein